MATPPSPTTTGILATPYYNVHSDYVSKPTISARELSVITWTLVAISCIITVIRLVVRLEKFRKWSLDDILAFLAMSFVLAQIIVYHFGYEDLLTTTYVSLFLEYPPPNYTDIVINTKRLSAIGTWLFYLALWSIKFSILAFFRRLGNNVRGTVIIWWSVVIFTAGTFAGNIVTYHEYCAHYTYASCISVQDLEKGKFNLRYSVAVDVISDIMITAIPIIILWNVQIPLKRKLTLLSILCTDIFVIVASAIRLKIVSDKGFTASGDVVGLWNVIEVTVALALCNMVAFRSLFVPTKDQPAHVSTRHRYFGSLFSFGRLSSKGGSSANNGTGTGAGTGGLFSRGRSTQPSSGPRGLWGLTHSLRSTEPGSSTNDSEKGLNSGYSAESTYVGKDETNGITTVIEGPVASSTVSSPQPSYWTGRSILVSQGMTVDETDPNYMDRWDGERRAKAAAANAATIKETA